MSHGPYVTWLADPAWEYNQSLKMADGVKRSSQSQYATMTVQQVCDLYTPSVLPGPLGSGKMKRKYGAIAQFDVADTALLGLWITAPFLLDGIHNRVCDAWGFTPRQIVPWIKGRLDVVYPLSASAYAKLVIQPGMGHLTRGCVEYLVLATRGKYTSLVKTHSENGLLLAEEDAFIIAPKSKHSRKPAEAYALLERLFPGPYIELFARERRPGWEAWGLEAPPAPYANAPEQIEIIEWP